MSTNFAGTLIRPLAGTEYMFHQFAMANPLNFVLGAEFPVQLTAEELTAALSAVQKRHPLLSAHIENRPDSGYAFYRSETAAPIEPTVLRQRTDTWTQVASAELSRPFETSKAPLMRAVLIQDTASSMLLLSFDHVIADGMAAVYLLRDLLAALNGHELEPLPVPPPQEELIERASPQPSEIDLGALPVGDPRMAAPGGEARDVQGIPLPPVQALELDAELTSRIVERCKAEGTTVHALFVTVASRVTSTLDGKDFVRVMTPVNHRDLVGAGEGVGVYNFPVRTGSAPHDGTPLWDQARAVRGKLSSLGSLSGIAATMAALRQAVPADTDPEALLKFVASGPGMELNITNLGVVDLGPSEPIRPTRIVGPLIVSFVEGYEVISVATFAGRMRICGVSHAITEKFFTELRQGLVDAVR